MQESLLPISGAEEENGEGECNPSTKVSGNKSKEESLFGILIAYKSIKFLITIQTRKESCQLSI